MIERLEWMHSKNFVHRDLKPENIMIGHGKKQHLIYLIDFGLAKRYKNPVTGQHIENNKKDFIIGTIKFLSIESHKGFQHGRRDDLEALGRVLISLMKKGYDPEKDVKMP